MSAETQSPVAVVTGVTSGIGAATAKALIEDGYQVFGLARRADRLDALKADLGDGFAGVVCDLRDRAAITAAGETVLAAAPKIDLLVNNAGLLKFGEAHKFKDTDMDAQVETMLIGLFLVCRTFLPGLLVEEPRKGGLIVTIGSVSGEVASPKMGIYGAVKAGVISYAKSLASEYADRGIRSVVINPGVVKTDLMDKFSFAMMAKGIPLKRMAQAQEIADLVRYVASEKASFMTGNAITIDGGTSL